MYAYGSAPSATRSDHYDMTIPSVFHSGRKQKDLDTVSKRSYVKLQGLFRADVYVVHSYKTVPIYTIFLHFFHFMLKTGKNRPETAVFELFSGENKAHPVEKQAFRGEKRALSEYNPVPIYTDFRGIPYGITPFFYIFSTLGKKNDLVQV